MNGASIAGPKRPTTLLVLLAGVTFLTVLDGIVVVSNVPLLRNPAGILGLALAGLYFLYRRGIAVTRGGAMLGTAFFFTASVAVAVSSLLAGRSEPFVYLAWAQVFVLFLIAADLAKDNRALAYVGGGFVAAMCWAPGFSYGRWGASAGLPFARGSVTSTPTGKRTGTRWARSSSCGAS